MAYAMSSVSNKSNTTATVDYGSNFQHDDIEEQPLNDTENTESVDETDTIINGRRLKSDVWNFAKKITPEVAQCGKCERFIKTSHGGTTTIRKHLIEQHQVTSLSNQQAKDKKKNPSMTAERKARLDHLVKLAIFEDGRTFGDFRRSGMMKFLSEALPDYRPPHRNQVQQGLKRLHGAHMSRLKRTLHDITSMALTTDFWSDRNNTSFLCITGHYIGPNMLMKSTILHFHSFDERHVAENISAQIGMRLQELKILEKIKSVTCDGAFNMQNAFKRLQSIDRFWCIAHRLHLLICNGLWFWKNHKQQNNRSVQNDFEIDDDPIEIQTPLDGYVSDGESIDENASTHTVSDEVEKEENTNSEDDEEGENNDLISDAWRNGVLSSDVSNENQNDDDQGLEITKSLLANLIHKCRLLIKTVKRSQMLTSFFHSEAQRLGVLRRLQLDCKTRWNSTYTLLCSLLENKRIVLNLFENKRQLSITIKQKEKLGLLELSSDEWVIIGHLVNVLEPFYQATELLSGTTYPTIGLCLFALRTIKEYLEKEIDNEPIAISMMKRFLIESFDQYFNEQDEQNELLKSYAYFDPMGFSVLSPKEKLNIERDIKEKGRDLSENQSRTRPSSSLTNTETIIDHAQRNRNSSADKPSRLEKFIQSVDKSIPRTKSRRKTISEEIIEYRKLAPQNTSTNAVDFWQTHGDCIPILREMARSHLSTPGTSVASESAFSSSAYVARKERARLSAENLSYTVFLQDKLR